MYCLYSWLLTMGTGSLDTRPPDTSVIEKCKEDAKNSNCPCFVAEIAGEVGGFAYAEKFTRENGYRFTVKDYVYVHPEAQGEGVATQLLSALIAECTVRGFRQMITFVGDKKNKAAIHLHEKCGFKEVGCLKSVGFKFDEWLDTILMQRALGPGSETPEKEGK
ncbi:MAG: N-acetyltransferase family protein, partial [Burkholderiales bacterium]|nr:N-acetyltransferase family protein [Burkholderiales bacterium]